MTGATLIGQGGDQLNVEALEGKTMALYFSAHWCPPCRGFTPQFAEWYTDNLKAKGLEVIFVSSDRDEDSFKEYFKEMPWLALNYSDQKRKQQLSTMFGVSGIPALVIVGPDGSTITKEGRGVVSSDPEGADFPWYPKPVVDLKSGPGSLNEVPTVIAFCEGCDAVKQASTAEAMTPLAQQYIEKQKSAGEEDPAVAFMIATEAEGIAQRIREIMKLPKSGGPEPQLMLINIPDEGAFYLGPEGAVTPSAVAKFVTDYEAKTLKQQQLKQG
jgi:nucleoredoxin